MLSERLQRIAVATVRTRPRASDGPCKRSSTRKQTSLPGLLTFPNMRLQVPCTISDMSGSGARLTLSPGTTRDLGDLDHLPDRLTLHLRADRMQVDCEVRWRHQSSLGVRFLAPPKPQPRTSR